VGKVACSPGKFSKIMWLEMWSDVYWKQLRQEKMFHFWSVFVPCLYKFDSHSYCSCILKSCSCALNEASGVGIKTDDFMCMKWTKRLFQKVLDKIKVFFLDMQNQQIALHNRTADWPAVTVMYVLTERTLRWQPLLGPLQMTHKWTSNRPT